MNPPFVAHRQHIQTLIEAAVAASDPGGAVHRYLRRDKNWLHIGRQRYDLQRGNIYLVAAGKAALAMSKAAINVLGDNIGAGIVIAKQTKADQPRRYSAVLGSGRAELEVFEASHPVADESNIRATDAVAQMMNRTKRGDLVLCLISGGASALLTQPTVDLLEWQRLTQALLESGCTINELNSVRKQLDKMKGGGLAEMAAPAAVVSLILSDVVGNSLDSIGSGPTAPNPESPAEALTILHRYRLDEALPTETWEAVTERLTNPRVATSLARFEELEVANIIVGDVRRAAEAAATAAGNLGFRPQILTAHMQGEAREVGRLAAALALDAGGGDCFVLGGETTVTVQGDGCGGRNQELALAAALILDDYVPIARPVVTSFATDGEDGPTDAAGAIVAGETVALARHVGIDPWGYLARNDSHTFFVDLERETGERFLLRTGSTGTNVNDLLLILAYPRENG